MIYRAKQMLLSALKALPQDFVKNLKWQYLGNLGASLIGGLYFFYLGHALGVAEFGLYALCLSVATLIFGLSDMRVQEAVIRFAGHELAGDGPSSAGLTVRTLFAADVAMRIVGCMVACLLSPLVAVHIVKDASSASLVCLAAAGLALSKAGFNPALGVLRLTDRFDLTAQLQLADWSLRFAITAALVHFLELAAVHVLVVAALVGGAANLMTIAVAVTTWHRTHRFVPFSEFGEVGRRLIAMRPFLISSYGINIVDAVVRDLDTTVIGLFTSVEQVGLYRMVKNVAQLIWRTVDPIFLVLMPTLSKFVVNDDQPGLTAFLRRLTALTAIIAIVLVLGANIVVPVIVREFLPAFSAIIALMPWMTWWVMVALPLVWTHALAAATGRPDIQFRASLAGNAFGAVLLFALTPVLSITGAAIAWSVSLAGTFALGFVLLKRERLL